MSKVYEIVTNQIIERLEEGTIPWRRPFQSHIAVNWQTQRSYRGINTILLPEGEYATFNQIKKAGGKIKKGEKSRIAIFWKLLEKENKKTEETEHIPIARYYRVFEINTQVEGLESRRKIIEYDNDPIEEAEKIKKNYMDRPTFSFKSVGAWYRPSQDHINVPPIKEFENVNEFYSVMFHEMIHSTGHRSRLNREGVTEEIKFGSERYSKEELIAEIGASILCSHTGIIHETIDNSASYISHWLKVLKEDNRFIVNVAQQAQKAVDYILGTSYDN